MWTNIFDEHRASEALIDAATWSGHGVNVGSAEDAQEKQEKRRLVELVHALLGAHVLHVLRGAHLLVPGRPGEARDRVFGVAGESLRTGGHVLGAGSPKNEVLQSDQKVSYLD